VRTTVDFEVKKWYNVIQMSGNLLFPIEYDVTLAEVRARFKKKGFVHAASADASKFGLSWTADADDCVRLPEASTDTTLIKAGTYVYFDDIAA
jgi:hypothetical protein